MGLKPWRNALHQRGDWENARALHARVFGWISGFRVADISLLLSRSRLRLVRSFSSLSLFLFLFVSLTSLCPLSQANYLLVRYQIPPVLPVISCPVLPCSSALSSLFSPSCREILSNSSTRGSLSLSLFFFFDSPRHFSFHRIVQLVLFHYYVAQILWSQLWYNTATIGWKLLIWPVQKLPIIIVKFERYIRFLSIRILDKFLSFSSYTFLSFFWLRSISTRVSSNAFPAHFHFDYSCQVLSVGRLRPARN